MKIRKSVWWLHKYLSYFVFLQIFLWIAGGIYFATVPFQSWVKGSDYVAPPALATLPDGVWQVLPLDKPVRSLTALSSAQGVLVKASLPDGVMWFTAEGEPAAKATSVQIERFAQALYRGPASALTVQWLEVPPSQMLGLVRETGNRTGLWQASFAEGVRLYFGARGEFQLVRTDYWIWYDALWRLHIMDYGVGEDFNNGLLRFFAWLAFVFVLTGLIMSFYAVRRTLGATLRHK